MATWRVLTWNLHGSQDPDVVAVAARLRALAPDVAALQEVRRSQARRLGELLGWRVTWKRKHYPYSPLVWWRAEGMAIATPWALDDVRRDTLSTGEPIWVYRHRIMVSATVRHQGDELRVHDLHLGGEDVDARIDQARRAASLMGPAATRVICGDLNAPDGEPEVLRELRSMGVEDPGGEPTNPADHPYQRIDYVLAPDDAVVESVETPTGDADWAALSDHLPVVVTFRSAPSSGATPSR